MKKYSKLYSCPKKSGFVVINHQVVAANPLLLEFYATAVLGKPYPLLSVSIVPVLTDEKHQIPAGFLVKSSKVPLIYHDRYCIYFDRTLSPQESVGKLLYEGVKMQGMAPLVSAGNFEFYVFNKILVGRYAPDENVNNTP